MILICGAFLGAVMISFGKADRIGDAFMGSCYVCGSLDEGSGHSPDLEPNNLCCDGHDGSSQVLGIFSGQDTIVHRMDSFRMVAAEHSVLPDGPYLDQIEPPLI